jgi:hypothetical protein
MHGVVCALHYLQVRRPPALLLRCQRRTSRHHPPRLLQGDPHGPPHRPRPPTPSHAVPHPPTPSHAIPSPPTPPTPMPPRAHFSLTIAALGDRCRSAPTAGANGRGSSTIRARAASTISVSRRQRSRRRSRCAYGSVSSFTPIFTPTCSPIFTRAFTHTFTHTGVPTAPYPHLRPLLQPYGRVQLRGQRAVRGRRTERPSSRAHTARPQAGAACA